MRGKTITHHGALAKLPPALKPLADRPQWAVYREIEKDGRITRPPFQARNPERHADINKPSTWSDYATAVEAVKAGKADGLTFMITKDDPYGVLDLDDCRDPTTGAVAAWAQTIINQAKSYTEISPSGEGCHVWGKTSNGADKENRQFHLVIDGKSVAAEVYYHTKPLTVTGREIGNVKKLAYVDRTFHRTTIWGERARVETATLKRVDNGYSGSGASRSVEEFDRIIRVGPDDGANRSDEFHASVGHLIGCGRTQEQICELFEHFPDGVASRYISEDRLAKEVARSFRKFNKQAVALQIEAWKGLKKKCTRATRKAKKVPAKPAQELDVEGEVAGPALYAHGSVGTGPLKPWLVKGLIPKVGHGLLAGQWGVGKTFVALDLALAVGTGQPFLGYQVKRQSGALLFAYEGAGEVQLQINEAVRHKCGGMPRAPFRWYTDTDAPFLLQPEALETLIAMCRRADDELQRDCGLPLGLILFDTLAASAGYKAGGGENDSAAAQIVMTVLRRLAQEIGAFCLAVDHFGKSPEGGTRGSSGKEASADLVLACLGEKSLNGSITNTRLAVRKNRCGRQGQQYPFSVREVAAPEPDEDGDEVTTLVIDWLPASALSGVAQAPINPWTACCRREDQKTTMVRLERALTDAQTEHGAELPVSSDGPLVRMVDQELVRKLFYERTPAEGTPKQQRQVRSLQFNRAFGLAYREELVGIREIEGVTYLWLSRITHEDDEMGDDPGVDTSASTLPSSPLGRSVDAQVSTLSGQAEANHRKVEEAERTSLRRQAEAERRRSGP